MRYLQYSILMMYLVVLLAGCKKDNGGNAEGDEYYIRFKANGVQKEYKPKIPNNRVSYLYLDEYQIYNATITGLLNLEGAQVQPIKNFMNIVVRSKEKIKVNNPYLMQTAVPYNGIKFSAIELTYADEAGKTFGALLLKENYPLLEIKDDATVNFDLIRSDATKGRFSGRAFNVIDKSEMLITDGEFYLPGGQ